MKIAIEAFWLNTEFDRSRLLYFKYFLEIISRIQETPIICYIQAKDGLGLTWEAILFQSAIKGYF